MDRRRCRGRAASSPPWPLLLLLLLLAVDGARCLGDKLVKSEYEARLEVLKLALALNEEWSPVWSEKLNAESVAERHPDPNFCMRLTPVVEVDVPADLAVDTYTTIKKIVENCSFSGMYVKFGMSLIGASLQCLFNRFAQIDLSAVTALVENPNDEFHQYLRDLVQDYREIADKLSAVGESLRNLMQLVTFFDDVEKQSTKLTTETHSKRKVNAFYTEVKDISGKLGARMDSELELLCAVEELNWYDKDAKEMVSLEEFKDKKKKKKNKKKKKKDKKKKGKEDNVESDGQGEGEEKKDKDKDKKGDKKLEEHIKRANELRVLMRKVFERLLIREMPSKMWEDIFNKNILMNPADIKQVAKSAPKNKVVEVIDFEL